MKQPKEPKRAKKAVKLLDELKDHLKFYMLDIPKDIKDNINYIREALTSLSVDDRVKMTILAKKIKQEMEDNANRTEHNTTNSETNS